MNQKNAEKMAQALSAVLPSAHVQVEERPNYGGGKSSFFVYLSSSLVGGMNQIYSQDELDDLKAEHPQFASMERIVAEVKKQAGVICKGGRYDADGVIDAVRIMLEAANEERKVDCPGNERRPSCEEKRFTDEEECGTCRQARHEHDARSRGRSCAACGKYFYSHADSKQQPSENGLPQLCLECVDQGKEMPVEYFLMIESQETLDRLDKGDAVLDIIASTP